MSEPFIADAAAARAKSEALRERVRMLLEEASNSDVVWFCLAAEEFGASESVRGKGLKACFFNSDGLNVHFYLEGGWDGQWSEPGMDKLSLAASSFPKLLARSCQAVAYGRRVKIALEGVSALDVARLLGARGALQELEARELGSQMEKPLRRGASPSL